MYCYMSFIWLMVDAVYNSKDSLNNLEDICLTNILNFEENSDGTIVSVLVNAGEKENPHMTHMNRYMMDKFFLKKLDATPLEC